MRRFSSVLLATIAGALLLAMLGCLAGPGPLGVAEAWGRVETEGQGQQVAARQDSDQWLMVTALAMAARLGQGSAENGLKQMVIYHYRHQAGGGQ